VKLPVEGCRGPVGYSRVRRQLLKRLHHFYIIREDAKGDRKEIGEFIDSK
jgi:hypothetical protein